MPDSDFTNWFLRISFWATAVWLALTALMLGVSVWIAFYADPAWMAAGSLHRESPLSRKLQHIGLGVLLVLFGVLWLLLIRYLQRRATRCGSQPRTRGDHKG